MKEFLESKHQVKFIHGNIKSLKHDGDKVTCIQYIRPDGKMIEENDYDYYVISCGIGSLYLGHHLGIRVPIYGFKGHSLNLYVDPKQEIIMNDIIKEVSNFW
jgi:NADH dehydrogenase FAD-containing subunit